MANTIFLSDNQVPDSTISATTGVTSAQFPLTNINTDATTNVARVSQVGNLVVIDIQLAQDTTIDTIAVVGSNLDGLGYTSAVARHSLTSDFSSATDITIDLNQQYAFGYAFFTSALARNVQITFENTGSFVEISKIYIGARTELAVTYSRESFQREISRNDEITENIIGNRFVNVLNARDVITGTYPLLESANFLAIEALFVKHGSYEPIWVMLDQENQIFTNGEFKLSMYSYFNNMFAHDFIGGGYFNVEIDLIEVV